MERDENTRAGIEVVGGKGKIFITGEITHAFKIKNKDIKRIVKRVLDNVGYSTKYKIIVNFSKQSGDIARGVDVGGAGDQGMMFGYACDDTYQFLPLAQVILQELAVWYDEVRKSFPEYYFPDGKAQITGWYDNHMKLQKIKTFLVSYQNRYEDEEQRKATLDRRIIDKIIQLCNKYNVPMAKNAILINPTGAFVKGGFDADSGLTGRKIVVDAYQCFANVGGGNMNGKDPSKVDFSAAHKARQLAILYLKSENLTWCEVQLSYAIGREEPLAIYICTNKGNIQPTKEVYEECKPNNIIKDLNLKKADFEELAKFGHFTSEKVIAKCRTIRD